MKKTLALLAALAMMTTVMTGCGDSEETATKANTNESVAAEEEIAEDEYEEEAEEVVEEVDAEAEAGDDELSAALQEFANVLDGTMWVGMDASYNTYAMAFEGNEMELAANDGSMITGYWMVGESCLYMYEDEEYTTATYEIPWSYDLSNDLMVLNETAVMAQVSEEEAPDVATALEQYSAAAQVASYLDGTYWVSIAEESAEAICIENGIFDMIQVNAAGEAKDMQLYFSMDYNSLYLYDAEYNLVMESSWEIAEDGSVLLLNGEEFTQCSEEDAVDIMAYLVAAVSE